MAELRLPQNLSAATFSIAAAHGITPRVVGTWHPALPRTPRVLVPVQLDALVVRTTGDRWADCLMRAPSPDAPRAARRDLLPPPFQDLAATRPRGAYLHWALPDALTHGVQSGTSAQFPAAPDRWLVLRMFPSVRGPQRRAVRGWVLRAGDRAPLVTPLDSWTETGAAADGVANPLTALGHGDPAWAAYYDNVVNRLGFYDDLQDVASGPLAYLVCGWYADPARDPLGDPQIKSLTDFHARLAELRWALKAHELEESVKHSDRYLKAATMIGLRTAELTLQAASFERSAVSAVQQPAPAPGTQPAPLDDAGHPIGGSYLTNGTWWPRLTLYHGSVVGIGWPGLGWPGNQRGLLSGEEGGPPRADAIKVAVGNTLGEALASLVAAANGAPTEAQILEAFMLGGLAELDHADGRARLDALLHASAFGSLDGGSTTERIWQPPMPPPNPTLPAQAVQPQPGIFPPPAVRRAHGSDVTTQVIDFARVDSGVFMAPERAREISISRGALAAAFGSGVGAAVTPSPTPGHFVEVRRSLPRLFYPADPVLLVQGGARSFKHGGDGRFAQDGTLECRLTGFCVTELSCSATTGLPNRPSVRGDDLLERGAENGSVPPECEDLLLETALLDPGASVAAAHVAHGTTITSAAVLTTARNFSVEQTAWWAVRDPRVDTGALVARSGLTGLLPSPVAVTPPTRPWNPIHLDWRIQFVPTALTDWSLDEIDLHHSGGALPAVEDTTAGFILEGRAHLTGGAAATIASGVRRALAAATSVAGATALEPNLVSRFHSEDAQRILSVLAEANTALVASIVANRGDAGVPAVDRSALADIATALEHMDVLAGAMDNFVTRLRGDVPGDGDSTPPSGPLPSPFLTVRSGFMRVLRLRLVDGFGQILDLAGSSDTTTVDPTRLSIAEPMQVPDRADLQAMPPRFTSPSRLWLRFMDAAGGPDEASSTVSPVCGYLMPNHLDGALEFFDAEGQNLGVVRPDPAAGVLWEDAPGRPSTVGQLPARAIGNTFLAGVAQGLLDWGTADAIVGGRETALAALLRIIDSTLWSIDPFGHTGDEHLALLVGHPVAVLRARVQLEVREPVHPADLVNQLTASLRLGALTHWQDGLLGYFVNDDYRTLYCADAAVAGFARRVGPREGFLQPANLVPDFYETFAEDIGAGAAQGSTPVTHPYVDDSGLLTIAPNQQILLTLLLEPHSVVHATTGLLPRKEIGMRREWVAAALSKLSPTFRFGPVLVDPQHIRMPVPTERDGTWSWDQRADVVNWKEDPVTNATADVQLPPDPAQGTEGWLRLVPTPPPSGGA